MYLYDINVTQNSKSLQTLKLFEHWYNTPSQNSTSQTCASYTNIYVYTYTEREREYDGGIA